jgi:hypothetical protein
MVSSMTHLVSYDTADAQIHNGLSAQPASAFPAREADHYLGQFQSPQGKSGSGLSCNGAPDVLRKSCLHDG